MLTAANAEVSRLEVEKDTPVGCLQDAVLLAKV
jgi:hypothetical protein